jgi:hypothetical protein
MSDNDNARVFRCDDAAGFELRILRSRDGDFHISVVPNEDDFSKEHVADSISHYDGCYSASVRIRMPMIGGGSHEALWHAIADVFRHDTLADVMRDVRLAASVIDLEANPLPKRAVYETYVARAALAAAIAVKAKERDERL